MCLPRNVDNVISPSGLRADALEELLQGRNQQRGLALPKKIHEHCFLLQSQVQKAQAVQYCRLQVLFTCKGRVMHSSVRTKTSSLHLPNSGACFLTGERCIGVQLADPLLQQAEAECQHGRVIEQVEHDAVARRLMGRDLLTLQFHNLLDKVRRLGLVVPQQLVEHLEDRVGYLPLGDGNEMKGGGQNEQIYTVKSESMFRVYTLTLGGSITFSAGRRYALVGKGRNTESRKKFK